MGAPKGRIPWNKGLKMEDSQKINSGRRKGDVPWNKGMGKEKKVCPKCGGYKAGSYSIVCANCFKHTAWNKGIKMPEKTGEKHILWKGNEASYEAKHARIKRSKGKAKKCSFCGKEAVNRMMHWANKDHKYSANPDDYIEMCSTCHGKYDKQYNLRKRKKNNTIE